MLSFHHLKAAFTKIGGFAFSRPPEDVRRLRDYCEAFYAARADFSAKHTHLQLHITRKCMNRCGFCYYRNREESRPEAREMPVDEAIRIIDAFRQASEENGKKPAVHLIGGDPLLHPGLFKLLQHLKSHQVTTIIKGNPHLLTKETVARFIEMDAKMFQLSIDGLRDRHDALRDSVGLFDRTLEAIRLLRAAGIRVMIRFTLSMQNRADLPLLQNLLFSQGIDCFLSAMRLVDPAAPANMLNDQELTETLTGSVRIFQQHLSQDPKRTYKLAFKDHFYLPLLHRMGLIGDAFIRKAVLEKWSTRCTMFEDSYIVDTDGTVRLCQKFPEAVIGKGADAITRQLSEADCRRSFLGSLRTRCAGCYYERLCSGCPAHETVKRPGPCPLYRET